MVVNMTIGIVWSKYISNCWLLWSSIASFDWHWTNYFNTNTICSLYILNFESALSTVNIKLSPESFSLTVMLFMPCHYCTEPSQSITGKPDASAGNFYWNVITNFSPWSCSIGEPVCFFRYIISQSWTHQKWTRGRNLNHGKLISYSSLHINHLNVQLMTTNE